MKEVTWDYTGYKSFQFPFVGQQNDWNATLLTKINIAFDSDDYIISEMFLHMNDHTEKIFKSIVGYNDDEKKIFRKKVNIDNEVDSNVIIVKDVNNKERGKVVIKNRV